MSNREWIEQCLGRLDKEAGFKVSCISEDENFRIFGVENEYEFWKRPLKIVCKEVRMQDFTKGTIHKGDLVIWYIGAVPQKIVRLTDIVRREEIGLPCHQNVIYEFNGISIPENGGFVHFECEEDDIIQVICMDETEKLFEAEKQSEN